MVNEEHWYTRNMMRVTRSDWLGVIGVAVELEIQIDSSRLNFHKNAGIPKITLNLAQLAPPSSIVHSAQDCQLLFQY